MKTASEFQPIREREKKKPNGHAFQFFKKVVKHFVRLEVFHSPQRPKLSDNF
jgi:hypothetical protein